MPNNGKKELYSEKIKVGRRTYFFDVKTNKDGDRYLVITESKSTVTEKFRRDRILIFEEHLEDFNEAFQNILLYFKDKVLTKTI
ncbi:DUF3276 family protein [bacterium]